MIAVLKFVLALLCYFQFLEPLGVAQDDQHQFIYNGFVGANLLLNGIAKIHRNGLLELTNTSNQQIGRAFIPFPLKFTNNSRGSLSFSTSFVFAMVPEFPASGGHGMAFTISPSAEFSGALPTQFLGLFNSTSNGLSSNHVFAVELDTVRSPDLQDIDNNHIGVDVNSVVSNVSAPVTYFSDEDRENKSLQLTSGDPIQAWIDYDGVEKLINVTLAPITSQKPSQPLLSAFLDLSLILMDSMYVGFSSSTGGASSYHYILGWSFSQSGQAQGLDKSQLPSIPTNRKSKSKVDLRILMPSITGSVLLLISGGVYIHRRKKYEEVNEDWEQEYGPQRFSYKDLYKATKGFKDGELVGRGGFGSVYRGELPSSNVQIAVKKISHDTKQGMKEFVAEIVSMGRLRHRNLVQLLGYCRRKGELLLVYDYMPNGSLDNFLFSDETPNLDWIQRYQILRGVASALLYLHEEWEQVVLHRDVKASNVLLDADLNGRLGDFGLARFHDHGATPQTTCVVGTIGYLAPELTTTGRATTSSDVFSFGIFLLEIACGRKPVEPGRSPEEVVLADWVMNHWRTGSILRTSDPRLEGKYVVQEMELVLRLGLLCTHPTPAARPTMREVLRCLDGNATLPGIQLDGFGHTVTGLITISPEEPGHCVLSFPESHDYYEDSFSSTNSILGYGH